MSARKQDFQILISCPRTKEQVLGEQVLHFSIQGRKGVWWRCPSCQGWHVMVYGEEANEELISPGMNQLYLSTV
ncbi:MAG: hypothetical protein JXM69_08070 [Anaerolineae bacterium]|nr:hypothetical protein [Anaerolineae bacterium]